MDDDPEDKADKDDDYHSTSDDDADDSDDSDSDFSEEDSPKPTKRTNKKVCSHVQQCAVIAHVIPDRTECCGAASKQAASKSEACKGRAGQRPATAAREPQQARLRQVQATSSSQTTKWVGKTENASCDQASCKGRTYLCFAASSSA
jgi:hypothetical protein